MADDGDEEGFGGLYENGHWMWDNKVNQLSFVGDLRKEVEIKVTATKLNTGQIQFRDDVDLIEQMRYRRRYQRKLKPGQPEVVTLQDVKDIAIFTAPLTVLSRPLINMLHRPTTERFLRALIFYCQYYLQISDEMARRIIDLKSKIPTPEGKYVETQYRDNLSDLRLLVAKEYCIMLVGGADMKNFHHMGPEKKSKSLSDKDAQLIEMFLRISIQIVWLALGRQAFNKIEIEVNRIFKSDYFNCAEHMLKTNFITGMVPEERNVLLGSCVRADKKPNTCSPLLNEVVCHRIVDYRIFGLGVIKYPQLTPRLKYMLRAIADPEDTLAAYNVTLGILGMPMSSFDTMLCPIPTEPDSTSKPKISFGSRLLSTTKSDSAKKVEKKLYPPISIPDKGTYEDEYPDYFPSEPDEIRPCDETQRKKWVNRYNRLVQPHGPRKSTT